jgi:ribokinase
VNDSSGTALITVNADGQNSIVVVPGANATLGKEDIEGLRDTIQSAAVLVVQLEIPLEVVTQAIDIAYTAGLIILLNPAPAMSLPQETLQKVTYLIPNESELALLSGLPTDDLEGCRRAAQVLLSKGCNQIVITRGDQGAFVFNQTGEIFVPSFKVPVVDTTAAGDAFIGGLAAALADGIDLQIALLRASAAGALAVTKAGAQTSLPDITELDDFLKKHKQEVKTH